MFDEKGTFQKIEKFYSDKLIKERMKHPDVIVHANIPYILGQNTITATWKEALTEIQRLGEKNKTAVSMPIILEHKLVGFLALGKKLSGDSYTSEDMKLLETFSYRAAVAIEKARLYEEVAEYSQSLERKVKERTQEIEELQQAQKQMMIDISHGLQTPLTTIKSELGFLKKQIPPNKKISVFEKSIDEVSVFIYDLLKLARLETGEEKFKKESMSFSRILREQVEYFEVVVQEHHIDLDSSIEDDIIIFGDKKKLEELTVNLVSNAIKYMKQKGKREIHIGLGSARNIAKLTIADNGIGISTKDLPHIFERFYRVENLNNTYTKGTGLGLAICKKIVERHEGTISVTSKLGKGTTFTITLPITPKSDIQQTR